MADIRRISWIKMKNQCSYGQLPLLGASFLRLWCWWETMRIVVDIPRALCSLWVWATILLAWQWYLPSDPVWSSPTILSVDVVVCPLWLHYQQAKPARSAGLQSSAFVESDSCQGHRRPWLCMTASPLSPDATCNGPAGLTTAEIKVWEIVKQGTVYGPGRNIEELFLANLRQFIVLNIINYVKQINFLSARNLYTYTYYNIIDVIVLGYDCIFSFQNKYIICLRGAGGTRDLLLVGSALVKLSSIFPIPLP